MTEEKSKKPTCPECGTELTVTVSGLVCWKAVMNDGCSKARIQQDPTRKAIKKGLSQTKKK